MRSVLARSGSPARESRLPSSHLGSVVAIITAASVACSLAFAAKPKKAPAKPAPAASDVSGPALPSDLNLASLQVKALDVLYELDLSGGQLKQLRAAAAGAGSKQKRSTAKGTDGLKNKLREFQATLLERNDDNRIDDLRNEIADLAGGDDVQLDDGVRITSDARTKAAKVLRHFKASQIAAFLAAHAAEVGDPVEILLDTADQVREMRTKAGGAGPAADKPTTDEIAALVQSASADVGELVAGLDETKAPAVAAEAAKLIDAAASSKENTSAARKKTLEQAQAIAGKIHPVHVLNNWLEQQVAELLSNPQLPDAIDAMLNFKETAK